MPIEFRCTQCGKLLRTPDDSVGKQARCPECGMIATVPAEAIAAGGAVGTPFGLPHPNAPDSVLPSPQPSDNPYEAPAPYAAEGYSSAPGGALRPTPLDFGRVFSLAWNLYRDNFGTLIVVGLILGVVSTGFFILTQFGPRILMEATRDEAVMISAFVLLSLVAGVIQLWLLAGQSHMFLKVARGQPTSLGDLFQGGRWMLPILGAGILWVLAYCVGAIFCIVPGVILALMFSQFYFLIVDRNAGVTESLSLSKQITEGNKALLFVLYIVQGIINYAGMLACGVGVIFTMPLIGMMNAVAYLMMSGQPIADAAQPYASYGVPQPAPLPTGPYPSQGQNPFGPGNPPV